MLFIVLNVFRTKNGHSPVCQYNIIDNIQKPNEAILDLKLLDETVIYSRFSKVIRVLYPNNVSEVLEQTSTKGVLQLICDTPVYESEIKSRRIRLGIYSEARTFTPYVKAH